MKRRILEVKKKIKGYRVYKKEIYIRRGRHWHSWRMQKQFKYIHKCESYIRKVDDKGTFRVARLREDFSIQWLVEIVK